MGSVKCTSVDIQIDNMIHKKAYKAIISAADRFVPPKLRPLWEHEAGPKTVFFWGPLFKWGLVAAGLGDINRPVQSVSLPQSASLALTGVIWSRYCLIIVPKNWSLFAVNVVVAIINLYQVGRVVVYQQEQQNKGKK